MNMLIALIVENLKVSCLIAFYIVVQIRQQLPILS